MGVTKYRLWDLLTEKMMNESDMGNYIVDYGEDGYFHLLKVARFIPQQFTGLIDINNKEVYERDIVKFTDGYGIIRYEPRLATYEIEYLGTPKSYITIPDLFSEVDDQWLEVVGNEYEDSDLIFKGGNENENF